MIKNGIRFTAPDKASGRGNIQRRQFLQYVGGTALALGIAGCKKPGLPGPGSPKVNTDYTIDFSDATDIGVLNFMYTLEQLNAAFSRKVVENFPAGLTDLQQVYFNEINLHATVHREFYKNFLGPAALGTLSFDFSSIDFSNMQDVLTTSKTFEDLAVAAYNGVIARCKKNYTIILNSQIASVKARHAAWITNLVNPNTFADLSQLSGIGAIAAEGRDASHPPAQVLAAVSKFIVTKLNVLNL